MTFFKNPKIWHFLLTALLLKIFYIQNFSHYEISVYGDMGTFWNGAFDRLNGITEPHQWQIFPPFYIFFLTGFLKVMRMIGLLNYSFKIAIFLNFVLQGISSYVVYLIALKLVNRKIFAFLALLFYSFSYPALYLNALIMPDNLAIPLLIISACYFLLGSLSWLGITIIALMLGIAICAKPLLLFVIPAFVIYLCKKKEYRKLLIFLLILSVIPILTIGEINKMSGGKVTGLAANSGQCFLSGWTDCRVLVSSNTSNGYWWTRNNSDFDGDKTCMIYTTHPFYDSNYFYKLGLTMIKNDPTMLIKKIVHFKRFFFGAFSPTHKILPDWYGYFMGTANVLCFIMFLVAILSWRVNPFLYQILVLFMIGNYIGLSERRYSFFIEFITTILFFVMLDNIYHWFKARFITDKGVFNAHI